MVKLEYRLVGNVNNPVLTKEFKTHTECDSWVKAQGNILVVAIESSGAQALNRIFG